MIYRILILVTVVFLFVLGYLWWGQLCFMSRSVYEVKIQLCTCPDVSILSNSQYLESQAKESGYDDNHTYFQEAYIQGGVPELEQKLMSKSTYLMSGEVVGLSKIDSKDIVLYPELKLNWIEEYPIVIIKRIVYYSLFFIFIIVLWLKKRSGS